MSQNTSMSWGVLAAVVGQLALTVPAQADGDSAAVAPALEGVTVKGLDAATMKTVQSALARAAQVWGQAAVVPATGVPAAGAAASAVSSSTMVGASNAGVLLLTGDAAAAATVLAQATAVLGASAMAVHLYGMRVGSIARYGNPYGAPAEDIAFPLLRQQRAKRARLARAPTPNPMPSPEPADGDRDKQRPGRVYATYSKYNPQTGLYYVGRTSAVIDLNQGWDEQAEAAVRARDRNHHVDENPEPDGKFRSAMLDRYAVGLAVNYEQRYQDMGYLAIRGREQQLIDYLGARRASERGIEEFHGGAHSDSAAGERLTENAIRGVARDNPYGEPFHAMANLLFGELAPYTGDKRF